MRFCHIQELPPDDETRISNGANAGRTMTTAG
jgi:hypothetical protein